MKFVFLSASIVASFLLFNLLQENNAPLPLLLIAPFTVGTVGRYLHDRCFK